jgi:hypothetical protein
MTWEHGEGEVIRINEAKDGPKRNKKPRKQINGKFNNIDSSDENKWKNITAQSFSPVRS